MKKRTLTMMIAVAMVLCCAAGGTLAWLTDKTETVTNTFTTSDVDITLEETTGTSYQMVPGIDVTKDPKVTVLADSEKCYLFVKLEKSANFEAFMEYTIAEGWTELTEGSGIYYREVNAATTNQDFVVIKDNQVTVKGEVTKDQMDALTAETYPTLTVTAYACQYMKNNTESFTPAEAWTNAQPTP